SHYQYTVATTFSLSFQEVENTNRAAAELLRLCAFLAPDAIPEKIFMAGSAALGNLLGSLSTDTNKLNEALELLRKYSFVLRNLTTRMLSIHRLVQAVLKDSLDDPTQLTL